MRAPPPSTSSSGEGSKTTYGVTAITFDSALAPRTQSWRQQSPPEYAASSTGTDIRSLTPSSTQDYPELPPQSQGVVTQSSPQLYPSPLHSPPQSSEDESKFSSQSPRLSGKGPRFGYSAATSAGSDPEKYALQVHRCQLLPSHVAVWTVRKSGVRLSAVAAEILLSDDVIKPSDLNL
jgi:hypothetical protein